MGRNSHRVRSTPLWAKLSKWPISSMHKIQIRVSYLRGSGGETIHFFHEPLTCFDLASRPHNPRSVAELLARAQPMSIRPNSTHPKPIIIIRCPIPRRWSELLTTLLNWTLRIGSPIRVTHFQIHHTETWRSTSVWPLFWKGTQPDSILSCDCIKYRLNYCNLVNYY